ncbi:hypothetical protein Taro_018135, partial [Colocasia esculenta]|nr:hypothetical protein [Colocasia esculenta]
MQTDQGDVPPKVKRAKLKVTRNVKKGHQESVNPSHINVDADGDNQSLENSEKQIVVYSAGSSNANLEASPQPGSSDCKSSSVAYFPSVTPPSSSNRGLPSVGAFAVQCATCFKWRLVPTKEKYEEIRENILQDPFVCQRAREWRSNISCDDPADISQDGSRLWAIDKPNISQPPPGWERILRIRGEGSTKFADVYYAAPSGKRLRSMVEVQKYLLEHPEYVIGGVKLSQFSFQSPRPLQENYVRKRNIRTTNPDEMTGVGLPRLPEPGHANPLSWLGPEANTNSQMGKPGPPVPLSEPLISHPSRTLSPPKGRKKSSSKQMYSGSMCNSPPFKVDDIHEADTHGDRFWVPTHGHYGRRKIFVDV